MLYSDKGHVTIEGEDGISIISDFAVLALECGRMGGLSAVEFLEMVKMLMEKAEDELPLFEREGEETERTEKERDPNGKVPKERGKAEVFDFSKITESKKRYRR